VPKRAAARADKCSRACIDHVRAETVPSEHSERQSSAMTRHNEITVKIGIKTKARRRYIGYTPHIPLLDTEETKSDLTHGKLPP
jgi:hypothetical protein